MTRRLAALALLASAATAPAQIELEVYSMRRLESPGPDGEVLQPYWRPIPLTDEGREQLARIVTARFPRSQRYDSHTWRIFQRLRDPQVSQAMLAAAALGGRTTVKVRVNPFDRRRSLMAGEVIEIPDVESDAPWTNYRVRRGDTFPRIAYRVVTRGIELGRLPEMDRARRRRAARTLVERILRRNRLRFAAWPAVVGRRTAGQYIRFGEYAFREGGTVRSTWRIDETLVHEAGHLGDAGHCSDAGYYYGPDHNHSADEVITAQAAFAEGWAHYQSLRVSSRMERNLGRGLFTRTMYYEQHSQDLQPDEFRVRHQVANEFFVARLLRVLEQASSRAAVEEAFRASAGVDCRTVADLIAAFDARHGVDMARVISVAFGNQDADGVAALAAGRLPHGAHRTQLPMHVVQLEPIEVQGSADPDPSAPRSSAPAGPYGL